jgi:hypothetical protein
MCTPCGKLKKRTVYKKSKNYSTQQKTVCGKHVGKYKNSSGTKYNIVRNNKIYVLMIYKKC